MPAKLAIILNGDENHIRVDQQDSRGIITTIATLAISKDGLRIHRPKKRVYDSKLVPWDDVFEFVNVFGEEVTNASA